MDLLAVVRVAMRALARNKMRTALTMLSSTSSGPVYPGLH